MFVDAALRRRMAGAAAAVAAAAGYANAGTIEFLLDDDGSFYFLEMNTRLQVEHPVTEMVTSLDLVHWQIRIARGERLDIDPARALTPHGHAIECRIYAEDPDEGFMPSPGLVRGIRAASGPGIRDDGGVLPGYTVPVFYDSMIAKLVAWAGTRGEAIARMTRALEEYEVLGIRTTIPFFLWLMREADYLAGRFDIGPQDGLFRIALTGVAAGVHVDRDQRLGRLDDQIAATRQVDARLEEVANLLLDLEAIEERHGFVIEMHALDQFGIDLLEILGNLVMHFPRVDPERIARTPHGAIAPNHARDILVGRHVDDLRQRPITIRVVARVGKSRQPALPVGREQTQRVPTLAAPALGDFATFEQNVVDRTLAEAAAHGKSRMPSADDDGGDSVNRAVSSGRDRDCCRDQFTWTVTFVGLVTMS